MWRRQGPFTAQVCVVRHLTTCVMRAGVYICMWVCHREAPEKLPLFYTYIDILLYVVLTNKLLLLPDIALVYRSMCLTSRPRPERTGTSHPWLTCCFVPTNRSLAFISALRPRVLETLCACLRLENPRISLWTDAANPNLQAVPPCCATPPPTQEPVTIVEKRPSTRTAGVGTEAP